MSNADPVRYFWLRHEDRTPFGCLAMIETDSPGTYLCAVSILREDEPFNRKRGRQIAAGRLRHLHTSFEVEAGGWTGWEIGSGGEPSGLLPNSPLLAGLEGAAEVAKLPTHRRREIADMRRRLIRAMLKKHHEVPEATQEGARCPRCNSPKPELHPAVQFEGEVGLCPDPFHASTEEGRRWLQRATTPPEAARDGTK